jgi:hypothetical protein
MLLPPQWTEGKEQSFELVDNKPLDEHLIDSKTNQHTLET